MAITIHPLLLGEAQTDTSFLVWGRTPGTRMTIPVSGYLVLGAGDPIVVDTGVAVGHRESGFHVFDRAEDQRLAPVLARHGVAPEDVGTLVLTHLHSDHTGELEALPSARIVVQRTELRYAAHPDFPAAMYRRDHITALLGPLFDRVEAIEGSRELADGVTATWTGGHSPGHQQLEVQLDSGLAIVTGDTAYLADPSVTELIPPGYVTSIPETMRALEAIRRDAVHVLPMHDPEVHRRHADGVR